MKNENSEIELEPRTMSEWYAICPVLKEASGYGDVSGKRTTYQLGSIALVVTQDGCVKRADQIVSAYRIHASKMRELAKHEKEVWEFFKDLSAKEHSLFG